MNHITPKKRLYFTVLELIWACFVTFSARWGDFWEKGLRQPLSIASGKWLTKPNFLSIHRFCRKRDKTCFFWLHTGMELISGCFVTFSARWGDFWEKGLRHPLSIASGKGMTKPNFLSIHRFCRKRDKTCFFWLLTGRELILGCFVTFSARWGDFWEKGLRQPLSIASGK